MEKACEEPVDKSPRSSGNAKVYHYLPSLADFPDLCVATGSVEYLPEETA
jgi:hypothetical protein